VFVGESTELGVKAPHMHRQHVSITTTPYVLSSSSTAGTTVDALVNERCSVVAS
jgi:hypothetical protein